MWVLPKCLCHHCTLASLARRHAALAYPQECAQGDVANFVETEQLVEIAGGRTPITSSYVIVRGSIPLLWSSVPNIKYKPTTQLAPLQSSDAPFDRHIRELLEVYQVCLPARLPCSAAAQAVMVGKQPAVRQHAQGPPQAVHAWAVQRVQPAEAVEPHVTSSQISAFSFPVQGVTAINLSNAHGSEGKLGEAYISQNKRFAEHGRGLRLVPFDFHAVCGGTHYERWACSAPTSPQHLPIPASIHIVSTMMFCWAPAPITLVVDLMHQRCKQGAWATHEVAAQSSSWRPSCSYADSGCTRAQDVGDVGAGAGGL